MVQFAPGAKAMLDALKKPQFDPQQPTNYEWSDARIRSANAWLSHLSGLPIWVIRKDEHHALVVTKVGGKLLKGVLLIAPNVKRMDGLWPSRWSKQEYQRYSFIAVVFSDMFFSTTPAGFRSASEAFSNKGNQVGQFVRLIDTKSKWQFPSVSKKLDGDDWREEPYYLFSRRNLERLATGIDRLIETRQRNFSK